MLCSPIAQQRFRIRYLPKTKIQRGFTQEIKIIYDGRHIKQRIGFLPRPFL